MPRREVYYVSPHGKRWHVKKEKGKRASGVYDTKEEAIVEAKKLAKKATLGQVKVQKKDGTFQTEYTYGEDPRKYRG
ncbi:MAG: DUF2188 domain-containing protein [Theionarchaea archaeon]|nr:MAG: hypothetical protein AYK18_06215 [Theionarchaea archaeon DG-70]MBU7009494.1 DUF2188 domain-containing protein [Theionarchaea archaeon]